MRSIALMLKLPGLGQGGVAPAQVLWRIIPENIPAGPVGTLISNWPASPGGSVSSGVGQEGIKALGPGGFFSVRSIGTSLLKTGSMATAPPLTAYTLLVVSSNLSISDGWQASLDFTAPAVAFGPLTYHNSVIGTQDLLIADADVLNNLTDINPAPSGTFFVWAASWEYDGLGSTITIRRGGVVTVIGIFSPVTQALLGTVAIEVGQYSAAVVPAQDIAIAEMVLIAGANPAQIELEASALRAKFGVS